jgi:hypothetical protein
MNRLAIGGAAAWLLASASLGAIQSKTIQGEMKSVTVSVDAIEQPIREVTVKKPDGTNEVGQGRRQARHYVDRGAGDLN